MGKGGAGAFLARAQQRGRLVQRRRPATAIQHPIRHVDAVDGSSCTQRLLLASLYILPVGGHLTIVMVKCLTSSGSPWPEAAEAECVHLAHGLICSDGGKRPLENLHVSCIETLQEPLHVHHSLPLVPARLGPTLAHFSFISEYLYPFIQDLMNSNQIESTNWIGGWPSCLAGGRRRRWIQPNCR